MKTWRKIIFPSIYINDNFSDSMFQHRWKQTFLKVSDTSGNIVIIAVTVHHMAKVENFMLNNSPKVLNYL